jgi:hypothetical protein
MQYPKEHLGQEEHLEKMEFKEPQVKVEAPEQAVHLEKMEFKELQVKVVRLAQAVHQVHPVHLERLD